MTARKNVLLLSIDSIRADRLGVYGYGRPTTPALDALSKNALIMDNAYTLAPFTQVACIQLFTSSRPYDYGGYDSGAFGRPDTLFKRFKDAGYKTWGLSTIHWVSPYYGYTDGLDEGIFVFHLNTLIGMAVMNMRDSLRVFFEGRIDEQELMRTAVPVIQHLFDNVDSYCDMLTRNYSELQRDFPHSKIVNDAYVPSKVRRVAELHRVAFENNPMGYIRRYLVETPDAHEWLARDWRYARTTAKLASEALLRFSNLFLRHIVPEYANRRATRYRLAVDAHAIARRTTRAIEQMTDNAPSFIWAHFKDCHQPYVAGTGPEWAAQTTEYLHALGHNTGIDPTVVFRGRPDSGKGFDDVSALYDCSILSTDRAIGNILQALKSSGREEETVVVICGDHGEEISDHGDYGHLCMHYEHNAKIPMMFSAPNLPPGRSNALATSMDLAPTITALAGIDPAADWVGAPVTDSEVIEREHLVLESFCRGNCIFEFRPLYMAVRTRRFKFIWREYIDPAHKYGSAEPMLFDLQEDPLEENNIYHDDHPEAKRAKRLLAERLIQVPEIDQQRIVRCFGEDITAELFTDS